MKRQQVRLKLADAMNTYSPALQVISGRGYQITFSPAEHGEGDWEASAGDRVFCATDPLRLLGLIALWESRGDNWGRRQDEGNLYRELIDQSRAGD